jgi:hypothetical protein
MITGTTHAGHGTKVCEYGITHGRCRCPSRAVIRIKCTTPKECASMAGVPLFHPYEPKHRNDDLE